jgi:hypothetical protein
MHVSEPLNKDEIPDTISGQVIAPKLSMMNDDVRAVANASIEFHTLGISIRKRRSIDPFSLPDPGHFEVL